MSVLRSRLPISATDCGDPQASAALQLRTVTIWRNSHPSMTNSATNISHGSKSDYNMTNYNGKCHCGSCEWTVVLSNDKKNHIMCHCETCKTLSGGAFTLNQVVPKSSLTIVKGNPACYTYHGDSGEYHDSWQLRPHYSDSTPGKPVHCYYCPLCTTHIYHHQEVMGPDLIVARTGVLVEAQKTFEIGAEIYGKDKWRWETQIAKTFDELPPADALP